VGLEHVKPADHSVERRLAALADAVGIVNRPRAVSRTYSRLLRTGLAEICDPIPINTPLRRHFDRLDQAIGDHVDQLNLAA
jgi:hypothetical protein